jgi:RHS repeat-associated protein
MDEKSMSPEKGDKGISLPSISLPKGGGAIKGIGEKFAANPVTGTGSMSVPIATSPGRSGFGPQLSISYDSGAGNGPFGLGWNLSLPSITRKTDKGLPQYNDAGESDEFILSGAEDLVPLLVFNNDNKKWEREKVPSGTLNGNNYNIQCYRPRTEGLFARIERWTNSADSADVIWRSISKENITTWYGKDEKSRIYDPDHKERIFSWLICESYDDKGNAMTYEYVNENSDKINIDQAHEKNRTDTGRSANRYLKRIKYGNTPSRLVQNDLSKLTWLFEVVFDYGEGHYTEEPEDADKQVFVSASLNGKNDWSIRQDPFSSYRSGFEVRTYRLCHRVLIFHHFNNELGVPDYPVRSTEFGYSQSPVASFIKSVTQSGYVLSVNDKYLKKSLPPLEFIYSEVKIDPTIRELDKESFENLPVGIDGSQYQFADLDGEGISGILTEQANAWFYKPALGNGSFGSFQVVKEKPSVASLHTGWQLLDLAGDGKLDIADFSGPVTGFYERNDENSWEPFKAFLSLPNIDWKNPNLKFMDINGDGHTDILITEDDQLIWYPSLAEDGFATAINLRQGFDEEKGPRVVFNDGTQHMYLADMSGDGLTDIVRIRNGEVCYWPNLGYARFGAKVTMDNAPWFDNPDIFNQQRIRLADIDGSGATDIIYLCTSGIKIYYNQSGNSWKEEPTHPLMPAIDTTSVVQVADILGNGTACLVWSSPLPGNARAPLKYIDLMGGQKPHLLFKTVNNLGAETQVEYASSTKFYLYDKKEGKPWITRLAFPMHVVERVKTYDRISRNLFVTRYAYHHGYFDGEEREFRGFGMVEQWDTEDYQHDPDQEVNNQNPAFDLPPVHTKTWFHTGVFIEGEKISRHFEGEYFREPGLTDLEFDELLLPDTILPEGFTSCEDREACRALRGSILRQEIYTDDPGEKSSFPYSVSERDYTVKNLQPGDTNKHAVFFVHPRETIDFHYERNPNDPRVGHQLTLEVDDFGNILKAVSAGYGRRKTVITLNASGSRTEIANPGLSELMPAEQNKQTRLLVTYTESDYTKPFSLEDIWQTPLPAEIRTYELTGIKPEDNKRFAFDELHTIDYSQVNEIPYEAIQPATFLQKRLIERVRTLYEKEGMPLPKGTLTTPVLPYETYKQAYTPGLLTSVFGAKLNANQISAILATEGKYLDPDSDGNWWIPSGRQQFDKNRFYLPTSFIDPLGNTYSMAYDNYGLLTTEVKTPLGNKVISKNDYRVLQPRLITDPNGNRSQVAFDALGLVVGTALMGSETENLGDNLNGFIADPPTSELDDFNADPRSQAAKDLLKGATTRIVYNLHNYRLKKEAVYAATLAREKHVNDKITDEKPVIQVSFSYSDGFGREIQKKIQAETGIVPERDIDGKIIVDSRNQPVMTETAQQRWVGTGWTVFNNKGKPVRQFEPFFADTHQFEFDVHIGVSPILIYDPADRVVATLHPNHTYEKIVFDAWKQTTWDVTDNVLGDPATDADIKGFVENIDTEEYQPGWHKLRTDDALSMARWPDAESPKNADIRKWEKSAAIKTALHAQTPTMAYFDSLGRVFLTLEHNKYEKKENGNTTVADEKYRTTVELDIEGNQRSVTDAKGRVVMRFDYLMTGPEKKEEGAGNLIHQFSMEAGERRMLNNVAGKEIYRWNSRNFRIRIEYDDLIRPQAVYMQEGTKPEIMVERLVYGEYHTDASRKLRTRLYRHFDQSGAVTTPKYDFKGNPLEATKQFAKEFINYTNWIGLKGCNDIDQLKTLATSLLESEAFTGYTSYDALNRPIQLITPHTAGGKPNVIQPGYNDANLLDKVDVWIRRANAPNELLSSDSSDQHLVTNIDYNAKGQREKIEYGNGVKSKYEYDFTTYRLIRMLTTRGVGFSDKCQTELNDEERHQLACPKQQSFCEGIQNLFYSYDPVGNITSIQDYAHQTVFFKNKCIEPSNEYTYDALYRLIKATGREHVGQTQGSKNVPTQPAEYDTFFTNHAHPHDGNAMDNYTEIYNYDSVGNIMAMIHQAGQGKWNRYYAYNEASLIEPNKSGNRLSRTSLPGDNENGPYRCIYGYDEHGNMSSMPHLTLMQWDYKDQLMATSTQARENSQKQTLTFYTYNTQGQRARKITADVSFDPDTNTIIRIIPVKERLYLGDFEIYREYNTDGTTILERESLSVQDGQKRMVLIETKTTESGVLRRLRNLVTNPKPLYRFQYTNHLGSACLELDEAAAFVSYEEFFPYGNTSFQSVDKQREVPAKRYRYTGKERDEESGLDYYGARYYASWLGRWCSCDPIGIKDGVNVYMYVRGNPINALDNIGLEEDILSNIDVTPLEKKCQQSIVSEHPKYNLPKECNDDDASEEDNGGNQEDKSDLIKITPLEESLQQSVPSEHGFDLNTPACELPELQEGPDGYILPADPNVITKDYWESLTEDQQKYLHYNRNIYQTCKDIPENESELIESEWQREGIATAHNVGKRISGNKDYRGVGPRAHQQAIYDSSGRLVKTLENLGTYDFVTPAKKLDIPSHWVTDVNPWIEWGNSPNDTSTREERIKAICSTFRGKIGYWLFGP